MIMEKVGMELHGREEIADYLKKILPEHEVVETTDRLMSIPSGEIVAFVGVCKDKSTNEPHYTQHNVRVFHT